MERWRDAKSLVLWELENQSKPLKLSRKGGIVVMGCHKYFMASTGNKVNKLIGDD